MYTTSFQTEKCRCLGGAAIRTASGDVSLVTSGTTLTRMVVASFLDDSSPADLGQRPQTVPTFQDARLGVFQLKTMGLVTFGGFKAYKAYRDGASLPATADAASREEAPASAAPAPLTDGTLVPPPPSSLPRVPPLSARHPWETARAGDGMRSPQSSERLPWESPRSARAGLARRPSSPRASVPPRAYARPATRGDAVGLGEKLRASLDTGMRHDAQDSEWHNVFLELVRQVYVHCNERGALLDTVRVHLESQLSAARTRLAEQQRELAQLRRQTALLVGGPPASGEPRSSSMAVRAQQDAKRAALEGQRVDALAASAGSLAVAMQAALCAKLVKQCGDEAASEVLDEAFGAAPTPAVLSLLTKQLERLRVTDLMTVLSHVLKDLSAHNRQMLMKLLIDHLDESERSRQVVEITKALPSHHTGELAKHLLQGLTKLARQPAVSALVKGLPKEERINMVADVLATVPLGDMLQLVHVRAGEMSGDQRTALVTTVLDTISKQEKVQLVQEQLVAMSAEERAEMLGSVFGLMTKEQRKDIGEKLAKTNGGADGS